MLLNTFDFIEKPVRLICHEKMGVNTVFDNSV
jgi:hypothetical protein